MIFGLWTCAQRQSHGHWISHREWITHPPRAPLAVKHPFYRHLRSHIYRQPLLLYRHPILFQTSATISRDQRANQRRSARQQPRKGRRFTRMHEFDLFSRDKIQWTASNCCCNNENSVVKKTTIWFESSGKLHKRRLERETVFSFTPSQDSRYHCGSALSGRLSRTCPRIVFGFIGVSAHMSGAAWRSNYIEALNFTRSGHWGLLHEIVRIKT